MQNCLQIRCAVHMLLEGSREGKDGNGGEAADGLSSLVLHVLP